MRGAIKNENEQSRDTRNIEQRTQFFFKNQTSKKDEPHEPHKN